jgi:hypothetical protein
MRGGDEKLVQNFVGKYKGKRSFGIARRRWEDNIKIDLKKHRIRCGLNSTSSE